MFSERRERRRWWEREKSELVKSKPKVQLKYANARDCGR